MKEYYFYVNLCGGSAGGTYRVKAENFEAAYAKAMDKIGNKLHKAFPDLEIDYDIEAVYDYDE